MFHVGAGLSEMYDGLTLISLLSLCNLYVSNTVNKI